MSKADSGALSDHVVIRPRHIILGLEAGLPGYRRGCRCDPCRGANAKRMREYRAKKRPDGDLPAEVTLPATKEMPAKLVLLKDLVPGEISKALAEELPAADGAYIFQRTVSAMVRQAARVLDNADKLERLDLISAMQIRIMDGLRRLEPPRSPSTGTDTGPTVEDIVNAIKGHGATQDGE